MTRRQQSKITMLMVLCEYLSQNTEVVNTIPILQELVNQLKVLINQVQLQSELQITNKTGVTTSKKEARTNLIRFASDVARKLSAYAVMVNDDSLMNEINVTENTLKRISEEKLINTCQLIYDRGTANAQAATQYGINARLLGALQSAINAFNVAIPKPRLSTTEKNQATLQIVALLSQAETILTKMNVLVNIVCVAQPVFFSGYKSARMIVDRVGRGCILKVSVLDVSDNQPVKGVTCKVVIKHGTVNSKEQSVVKKTAPKGGCFFKTLPEGSFDMIVSKSGYMQIVQIVNISKNEFVNLNILIEKL